ncbi:hypothetical protein ACFFIT_07285 [Thorsellia kenyensis]|uniref:Uncharacterized protein n=1 Tax=Thorsellia kenyensis TaxID=1549888 RepID=A0ABV6CA96_9GAMM
MINSKNFMRKGDAISKAVGSSHMKFVRMKNETQQGYLAIHKMRQNYVKARTACIYVTRGLLSEFIYHANRGRAHVYKLKSEALAQDSQIPGSLKEAISVLKALLEQLDENIKKLEILINQHGSAKVVPR